MISIKIFYFLIGWEVFLFKEERIMINYIVDILNLGEFIIEFGEVIDNLCLRYEYVGYYG